MPRRGYRRLREEQGRGRCKVFKGVEGRLTQGILHSLLTVQLALRVMGVNAAFAFHVLSSLCASCDMLYYILTYCLLRLVLDVP